MKYTTLYQEFTNSTEMIRALLAGVSADDKGTWSILELIFTSC